METQNVVLSISWTRFMSDPVTSDCYRGESSLTWEGNRIKAEIHCYWGHGPGGLRTNYNFLVNGEKYSYNMIDSYVKGRNGHVPKITNEDKELCFRADPTIFELIEMPVETK